ncbi:MAG: STAS domain-containing protein [Vulcanimicrobiaceae bacterium]
MCPQTIGAAMLVQLFGDLDIAVKDELQVKLEAAAQESNIVVIDLSKVEYADSTALGLFVALRNRLRERGGKVQLRAPSRQIRKLLEYAGLDAAFEVVDDGVNTQEEAS